MSLDDTQRRLYARHLLLAEIGVEGQARLCAARVHIASAADPRAAAWTRQYLERAGVEVAAHGAPPGAAARELDVASESVVDVLAGGPLLTEAAAALAGAFAAVEAIKTITLAGTPAALPAGLTLS